ncbi:MAG: PQQ-like beta-propeller repeat protein, partial [Polyangia bacterium]|nr:PQQ-like beta-propeller repeat protein [Polyangia bacterium]
MDRRQFLGALGGLTLSSCGRKAAPPRRGKGGGGSSGDGTDLEGSPPRPLEGSGQGRTSGHDAGHGGAVPDGGAAGGGAADAGAPRQASGTEGPDVPMFRGNPSHTFYGTGPLAESLTVLWKHRMGTFVSPAAAHRKEKPWTGTGWTGTAVAVGDRVYVGSLDSNLYAYEASTGKVAWRYKAGAMFKSSACYHAGRLFIGNVDNGLHCVDAATGKGLWRFETGRDLDSSPCVADGKLYFGGENGYLHCLEPESGKIIWRTFLGGLEGPLGSGGVESSPAVAGGAVFASTYSGLLFCVDALSGAIRWKARTRGDTDVS